MSKTLQKRTLGGAALKYVCWLLLGVCLLGLIAAPLWYVSHMAETMEREKTRKTAQFCVDAAIIFEHWQNDFIASNPEFANLFHQVSPAFQPQEFESELIGLDVDSARVSVRNPVDAEEQAILESLRQELSEQLTALRQGAGERSVLPADGDTSYDVAAEQPVYAELYEELGGTEYYVYYQPVYWKESCVVYCHKTMHDMFGAFWVGDEDDNRSEPLFRVMRVEIPLAQP